MAYKGILITQQIVAYDGLNTELDNPLLVLDSISIKLSSSVLGDYNVSYIYKIYKNSNMEGDPIQYSFIGMPITITCDGDDQITNSCYLNMGTYLTTQGISYNYITI